MTTLPPTSAQENLDGTSEEDILIVYGNQESDTSGLIELADMRRDFQPWHHPVKQIVREHQLAALTKRLLKKQAKQPDVLKYFTLPGTDLLDIRVLAETCEPLGVQIEYFGFDARGKEPSGQDAHTTSHLREGSWVTAESALRQAGRITAEAVIHADRLEDIAVPNSHASIQLSQRSAFDVINIDACDHLAYSSKGRQRNIFDALEVLLRHQMKARSPWLLFITTRAEPALLGAPGLVFQDAITQNLRIPESGFAASLAACIEADERTLASELASAWVTHDERFLRLYSVGLGKFLLQFFHAQPNLPAHVELASAYAYRIYGDEPDMLSLAFRITPDEERVFAPSVGGVGAVIPMLEAKRAVQVASQAMKLRDLDKQLESDTAVREIAINGIKALLQSARYDIAEWQNWLARHEQRPVVLT